VNTETLSPPETGAVSDGGHVAEEILANEALFGEGEIGHYVGAVIAARWRIVAFVTGVVALSVALALALPKAYTAHVVMLPTDDGESGFPGQLGGIASSFGIQLPFGSVSQSDLYPTLLTSERLLTDLLEDRFAPRMGAAPVPLADIVVKRKKLSEHEQRMRAVRSLREDIVRARKDSDTGVLTLSVTTDDPHLSADVANRLASRLETYLIDTRQIEGSRNRTFLDDRLDVVSADLRKAEEVLTRFRESNRRIQDSPELLLTEQRLNRDVLLQEQLFLELQRQKEVAKIEEVKNTPVLRVLDNAVPPVRPSRPHKVVLVAMGFVLGLMAAIGFVIAGTVLELNPALAESLRPFRQDWVTVRQALRRRSRSGGSRKQES